MGRSKFFTFCVFYALDIVHTSLYLTRTMQIRNKKDIRMIAKTIMQAKSTMSRTSHETNLVMLMIDGRWETRTSSSRVGWSHETSITEHSETCRVDSSVPAIEFRRILD